LKLSSAGGTFFSQNDFFLMKTVYGVSLSKITRVTRQVSEYKNTSVVTQ